MSDAALRIYEEGLKQQHNRNEARHIRTRVSEARKNPHPASLRWPFELLQNALDAGPRSGRQTVTVRVCQELLKVSFEHDGAAFNSMDLAALLSGGSSKEFESEVTTGRFGTGFLVTHVLAERTKLRGLLDVGSSYEEFELMLDRGGDETAILANIEACSNGIRDANPVADINDIASARFEYLVGDETTLAIGFQSLRQALPYLFMTRPSLGRVQLETVGEPTEVWTPGDIGRETFEDGQVESRSIRIDRSAASTTDLQTFRFTVAGAGAALVVLERGQTGWRVRAPEPGTPRVYREYPLRGSGFLPLSFVIDGKFEPDQERSRLLMNEDDRGKLLDAFASGALAIKFAFAQNWQGAESIARVSQPSTAFDPTNDEESKWWSTNLAEFAGHLASLPIVDCTSKRLPAISTEDAYADFIVPRLTLDPGEDETTVDRLWPLVEAATALYPPKADLAAEWTEIAEGWRSLGLQLGLISVTRLGEYVRPAADADGDSQLDQLKVDGDHTKWLAQYLDIVGECWSKRVGVDLSPVAGLMPNQYGRLCSPDQLRRDGGVSERFKDVCDDMGFDVRDQLLTNSLSDVGKMLPLPYLDIAIAEAIPRVASEAQVIDEAVKYIQGRLVESEAADERNEAEQTSSLRLIDYLWETQGTRAESLGRQIPLIASTSRFVRWSPDRLMMAPVCAWSESARPFSEAYPPARVLAEAYSGNPSAEVPNCVPALVGWGIAIPDPLTSDIAVELRERRLAAISLGDSDGVVVSGESFSQIALLQPEVINRCRDGKDEARALLGLVLCHIAKSDPAWRAERLVKGRKAGQDVEIRLRPALWLADLRYRAWVPVAGEDGQSVQMTADAITLNGLLDPNWLEKNDAAIALLSEWFGFDELELRLIGVEPDNVARQELRNSLAKLVESAGADPGVYASLLSDAETRAQRSRDVARCRRFGLAVQDAVKQALEQYGLTLTLVDRGFDYEVASSSGSILEDGVSRFDVGSYFLEVKATTSGGAKMTPLQAETAAREPSRYLLCVVDLRNVADAELDTDWTAEQIGRLARIITDIGGTVGETCLLVEEARTSPVGIRNDSALRYEVPPARWQAGVSIQDWVATLLKVGR